MRTEFMIPISMSIQYTRSVEAPTKKMFNCMGVWRRETANEENINWI